MSAMMPGQPGGQPPPAPPKGAPVSAAQGDQPDPNDPNQDQSSLPPNPKGEGGARPVGTVEQRAKMALEKDPTAKVPATKEQQKEYNDFVSQFLLFISNQKANGQNLSGHQATMRQLNDPKVPVAVAVGKTVATIAMIIAKHAEHQGKKYDPVVLFHANTECCVSVYMLGKASGIFRNVQPMEKLDKNGHHTFDKTDIRIIADSQIQAIKFFGQSMIHAGMLSPSVQAQNQDFWQKQIHREVSSGQVPQRVFQMLEKTGALQHMQSRLQGGMSAGAASGQDGQPSQGAPPPPGGPGMSAGAMAQAQGQPPQAGAQQPPQPPPGAQPGPGLSQGGP